MATASKADWIALQEDAFEASWKKLEANYTRLKSLQKTHDNVVSESAWPTTSRIPLPWAWAATETATGPAMEYLFPPSPSFRLRGGSEVPQDVVDKSSWALHLMLRDRMKIKRECTRSVKDCFKLDVGYGIVEPITITPPAVFQVAAGANEARVMGRGAPQRSLRYRYLSTGKVLPFYSGTDFVGSDPTPYAWLLDLVPEERFRKMFSEEPRDGEEILLTGDAEAMIKDAETRGFNSQTSFAECVDAMAGGHTGVRGQSAVDREAPTMVPILKCYALEEGRHTWIFPGSEWEILWDKYDGYDTMRCPMVKFDCWVDADRWFPMGMAEGHERVVWQKNILANAINDIIQQNLRRVLLWNSTEMEEPPVSNASGVMPVAGKPDDMAKYVEPPRVGQEPFALMEQMDAASVMTTAQRDMMQRNYTRGGTQAFQELLNTTSGRERLRHMLLETGGFTSIVNQTLIYMQTLGGSMNLEFQRPAFNQEDGTEYSEFFSVTEDDLKHSFTVTVDLESKARESGMDPNTRIMLYREKVQSNMFDNYEAASDLEPDESKLMRQRLPRDVVRRKQEQQEAAELQATAAGGGQGEPAAIPQIAGRELGGAA